MKAAEINLFVDVTNPVILWMPSKQNAATSVLLQKVITPDPPSRWADLMASRKRA